MFGMKITDLKNSTDLKCTVLRNSKYTENILRGSGSSDARSKKLVGFFRSVNMTIPFDELVTDEFLQGVFASMPYIVAPTE